MKKSLLEKVNVARFIGEEKSPGADYNPLGKTNGYMTTACDGGLPPGCNCVCNQPCNFGIQDAYSLANRQI